MQNFQEQRFLKNIYGGCFGNWDIFLVCDTYNFEIYEDSMMQT